MSLNKYFGTDGIRGKANVVLTSELALKVGEYLGYKFKGKKLVIGKDPRRSSDMLEHALAAGAASMGAHVFLLGTCATPALAYIIKTQGFSGGVMISASHNPYYDNGLKVFSDTGMKISAELESEIESFIEGTIVIERTDEIGKIVNYHDGLDLYIEYIEATINSRFGGLKIVLDLANGSAVSTGKRIFEDLGAEVVLMNDKPDGININHRAGSTHMDVIQARVLKEKADMGFAFDGDADRCLAVDGLGNIIDGDKILYVLGKDMSQNNMLPKNTVVSTVMANLGFIKSMEALNINVVQTDVGDKNVVKEMFDHNYKLGGEQSGHIVLMDYATTGDGVLTALKLAEVVAQSKQSLAELTEACLSFPQVLKNVFVDDKKRVMNDKNIKDRIKEIEKELDTEGRILVRPSGTELLVRVMVEARSLDLCEKYVDEVVNLIENL